MGTGSKVTCEFLGENIICGANCVVNKDFKKDNLLLTGIPAEIKHGLETPWYILHGEPFTTRYKNVQMLYNQMFSNI